MTWLKFIGPVLHVLAVVMRTATGWAQRRIGRLEAENVQAVQDRAMLRRAADARRAVDDEFDGLRNDPRNRDAN